MKPMSSDDYVDIRQIGKGAFGTAHIVHHKVTGERFVLKRVRLARQTARERQSSIKELHLLSNLKHRNVLELKGCWIEGGCNLCLLVELCESGDLFTQLRLRHPSNSLFNEEHLQEMAVQLLSALAYLHRSNIAHRDLKSANILITGEGCLKLADFGLSTVLDEETNRMTKTVVGTPNYMSPCVLQEKPYGISNDVWGLGCVLFELSALKPAFQAFNMAGLIKKVTSGLPPPMPICYSEHWRNLIRAMLTKEPDMRPSAEELLELDWLQPAVRRVATRFGPELPPGALDALERLSDLPPDIMGLMNTFLAQERDEKRRQDEARERRKAAVRKWDPLVRAAAAAQAQAAAAAASKHIKLPPLKPHVPRKPLPRELRATGRGGPLPSGMLPLVPGGGGGGCASPRRPAAGANGACTRRKTYSGEAGGAAAGRVFSCGRIADCGGTVGGCGRDSNEGITQRRVPALLSGGGAEVGDVCAGAGGRLHAAAWPGHGPVVMPPLPNFQYPHPQRQSQDGYGKSGEDMAADKVDGHLTSTRMRGHRPSSAPPDSPVRRSRRAARDGPKLAAVAAGGCGVNLGGVGYEEGSDRQLLDGTTAPLGYSLLSNRRRSSCCGDLPSVSAATAASISTTGVASEGSGGSGHLGNGVAAARRGEGGSAEHAFGVVGLTVRDSVDGAGGAQAGTALWPVSVPNHTLQQRQQLQLAEQSCSATFRYLPAVRNDSEVRCSLDRDSGGSSCEEGSSSLDAATTTAAGCDKEGADSRRSLSETLPPRRSNSESVLQLARLDLGKGVSQGLVGAETAAKQMSAVALSVGTTGKAPHLGQVASGARGMASGGSQTNHNGPRRGGIEDGYHSSTRRRNGNQRRTSKLDVASRDVGGGSLRASRDGQYVPASKAAGVASTSKPRVAGASAGTRRQSLATYGNTAGGVTTAFGASTAAADASQSRVSSATISARRTSGPMYGNSTGATSVSQPQVGSANGSSRWLSGTAYGNKVIPTVAAATGEGRRTTGTGPDAAAGFGAGMGVRGAAGPCVVSASTEDLRSGPPRPRSRPSSAASSRPPSARKASASSTQRQAPHSAGKSISVLSRLTEQHPPACAATQAAASNPP